MNVARGPLGRRRVLPVGPPLPAPLPCDEGESGRVREKE